MLDYTRQQDASYRDRHGSGPDAGVSFPLPSFIEVPQSEHITSTRRHGQVRLFALPREIYL